MSQHLPAVPRAGAWRAPRTPSSRWGRKTRSAAAPEAAEVWSGPTEGNLGRSSGIARQPAARTEEDRWDAGVSAGPDSEGSFSALEDVERRQKPLVATVLLLVPLLAEQRHCARWR